MPIRRIVLFSFWLLLFLVTVPNVLLSFYAARVALQTEIGRNLRNEANMLMDQIDMLMFERLKNVHVWSHREVMQEGRIDDIDKRLAQALAELEHGYPDVYRSLFFVNKDNQIVAAGDPALITQTYSPKPDWFTVKVPDGEVILETLDFQPGYEQADLLIRAPVPDNYSSVNIGQFYGVFDLRSLFRLFDQASHTQSGEHFVILLDAEGRAIAASSLVRNQKLLLTDTFASWIPQAQNNIAIHNGKPLTESPVLVGYARSKGYRGYANMGWSVLVIQTTKQAFEPIWALWWLFCSVFFVTGIIAGLVARWVSGRIAKPLLDLTQWVNQFPKATGELQAPKSGIQEVQALSSAFDQLGSDLEQSRQQVIRAAKLAVVGEMAAIMAHEVRTPLGILQTTAQMLQWEKAISAEGQEMTQMIVEESARLNRLIATLLDCARPRPANMQITDVNKIIRRVMELLATQAQKKAIQIECRLSEPVALIECDEELLIQVFLNLILNAIQILPKGGKIQVKTYRLNPDEINIMIIDDGPGIPEENRTRLFDPFFTTREGGIGLGLTVTHQIISQHGGRIWVEESDLKGAAFVLALPVCQERISC